MRRQRRLRGAGLIVGALLCAVPAFGAGLVDGMETVSPWHDGEAVDAFYDGRGGRPVWGPESRAAFRSVLDALPVEGLDPAAFHGPALRSVVDPGRRERLFTDAYLALGRQLAGARLDPRQLHERWLAPRMRDPRKRLLAALDSAEDPVVLLDRLRPQTPAYARLQDALARYRDLAAVGGWDPLPAEGMLRPGECSPEAAMLRARLSWELAVPAAVAAPDSFDPGLAAVLRRFQELRGLNPDGLLGPATRAALNVGVEARIAQILSNLERLRWAPRTDPERMVRVNIPDYRLEVVQGGAAELEMRVVVGRPDRPTPVLHDLMTYLELNPYWNIPLKIARGDVLPKILADADYLARQGIRVFEHWEPGARELDRDAIDWAAIRPWDLAYKLRQDPGAVNALGRIKFMFPNPACVYIHDTPSKGHFGRDRRAASSGCVRVADPVRLAEFLTGEELGERLAVGVNDTLGLNEPIPVRLEYRTAWADADGIVHFREDIYGHDAVVAEALAALSPDADLPATHVARVQVDEVGVRVVAHASGAQGQRGAVQAPVGDAGQADVHGAPLHVEAPAGRAAETGVRPR